MSDSKIEKLKKWARDNYVAGEEIDDVWNDIIQAECKLMNEEEEARRAQIREVRSTAGKVFGENEEFKGAMILHHTFNGSITMSKKWTPSEQAIVTANLDPEMKALFKGDKHLFGPPKLDPMPEWKAYNAMRETIAGQLKGFGIPFIIPSQTVIRVALIPEVEAVWKKIDGRLKPLLDQLLEAYPGRIKKAEEKLKSFFNPADYRKVDQVATLFTKFKKWFPFAMAPELDILQEFDMAAWEAEREGTRRLWQEVKDNGAYLLRNMVMEMTERLVEAVTPDEKTGERKRFYGTAISNLTDFFQTFENRNIADDKELLAEVEKLRALVEGKSLEDFKSNDKVRDRIKSAGTVITAKLKKMVTTAKARLIVLED